MPLDQMPAAGAHQQHRRIWAERVLLPVRARVSNVASDGVPEIYLAGNDVLPGWRVRVLEIGHEDVGAGIKRIDDHLPVHRAGDFNAPVHQILRNRGGLPVSLTYRPSLW